MGSSNRKASVHGVQAHPIAPNAPPRYPFAKLMALQSLGLGVENPSLHKYEIFRALVAPFRIESMGYAYGGHVYAQAAYAASKTVERGFLLHVCLRLIFVPREFSPIRFPTFLPREELELKRMSSRRSELE